MLRRATVYLLEDSVIVRCAISSLISSWSDFEVIGESDDGETAVEEVKWLQPDVVVCDIGLPGISGIEVTREVKTTFPNIAFLMLTAHSSDANLFDSFSAGAEGYILKDDFSSEKLHLALKSVAQGSAWLDPLIARRVLTAASMIGRTTLVDLAETPAARLNRIEQAILESVAADTGPCSQGICPVDPLFLTNLKRFSKAVERQSVPLC